MAYDRSIGHAARSWFTTSYRQLLVRVERAAEASIAIGMHVDSPERREFIRLNNEAEQMRATIENLRGEC